MLTVLNYCTAVFTPHHKLVLHGIEHFEQLSRPNVPIHQKTAASQYAYREAHLTTCDASRIVTTIMILAKLEKMQVELSQSELAARINSGFNQRRALLKVQARDPRTPWIVHTTTRSTHNISAPFIDLRSFSQRFLPRSVLITPYVNYMRTLLPEAYHDLLLGYYFGGEYVDNPLQLLSSPSLDDAQYSIVCQTLYLNGVSLPAGMETCVHTELTSFVAEIRTKATKLKKAGQAQGFDDFFALAASAGYKSPAGVWSLRDFEQSVGSAKIMLNDILGPDIFTILQQACDPDHSLPGATALRNLDTCQLWGLGDIYAKLLIIRATRNTDGDREPIEIATHTRDLWNSLSESTRTIHNRWNSADDDASPNETTSNLDGSISLLCKIRKQLASENTEGLVDSILALYDADSSLMDWLDWKDIYNVLRYSIRLEGLKIAAIHYLMGQPFVARKFQMVIVAEGDGAFESSLRSSVARLRTLESISTELSGLSGRCRELLINAILHPDTAAMLTVIMQHDPRWAKQLSKARSLAYDTRISAFRLDLAIGLNKAGLLEKSRAKDIIDEEKSRLRVAYLQGRQLNGLVHIDWPHTLTQLNSNFHSHISFVRRLLREQTIDRATQYRTGVLAALTNKITDFLLIDGPDNFKTTISDSLRHGQLPPAANSALG
ncbi:hypothetical protein [Bradyrhizobium sp. HKCCYLS20291]|uniref:hypothetical protein n=1 Tax=Bradyrhizobium sp. HKCCYLS20291 TaxID=3420766 RepID=UPI003EB8232A